MEVPMATGLSAVLEDYLGTVFRIEQQKGFARVRDVAADARTWTRGV